ncbi:hypothetical protein AYI70_g8359 [Smittium culicis]|uniref:Uncharacterized protein n=1 Tax=Smittium culicis TaxID=133412 RepID=A0A1R1XGA9_9FUNG|nr:hypothetical protein AYI70_g8359 [Smittium culicis]
MIFKAIKCKVTNINDIDIKDFVENTKYLPISYLTEVFAKNVKIVKNSEQFINESTRNQLNYQMSLYSISENDLYPWIIPKYSSLTKFDCCFSSNYTSINPFEYLFFHKDKTCVEDTSLKIKSHN